MTAPRDGIGPVGIGWDRHVPDKGACVVRTDHSMAPVVAALGIAVLTGMDAIMKIVTTSYPIGEVVGLRYATGAVFAGCRLPGGGRAPAKLERAAAQLQSGHCRSRNLCVLLHSYR